MKKIIALTFILALMAPSQLLLAASVVNPANGHSYELVTGGPWTWEQAKAAAEAAGGYLVSINTQQENDFITAQLVPASGTWIGGFQDPGGSEPAGGWEWLDGEPFTYTAWAPSEPNNAGGNEECAHFWSPTGTWNDITCTRTYGAYIVEYESGTARVRVTKDFSDNNDAEVTVTLECNDGFVSQDGTATISEGEGHTFVVTDFAEGAMDCSVTESGTDNYTTSPASCDFADMTAGYYECNFVNTARNATYTVHKEWNVGEGGDVVIEEARVTIYCDIRRYPPRGSEVGADPHPYNRVTWSDDLGDGDSLTASVDVRNGPAVCWSSEEDLVSSGVETTTTCTRQTLSAGDDYDCKYTNTVFFEGIPTLSQYGLALMALLMLGVGFVGFRRFV